MRRNTNLKGGVNTCGTVKRSTKVRQVCIVKEFNQQAVVQYLLSSAQPQVPIVQVYWALYSLHFQPPIYMLQDVLKFFNVRFKDIYSQ